MGVSSGNGGSIITGYELHVDKGDGSGYVKLIDYTTSTLSQALDIHATDTTKLISGKIYKFRVLSKNSLGSSQLSHELKVAAATLPAQASAPTWVVADSKSDLITVEWNAVASTEIQTTGYKLYMDDGNNGDFNVIYDGSSQPGTRKFSTNVTEGNIYRFKVQAVNFNGDGPISAETKIYACLPPSGVLAPKVKTVSTTSITLQWGD